MKKYFVGLDLGQAQDYTALCVIEKHGMKVEESSYHVRHLQRWQLGTSYPTIVASVADMLKRPPLAEGNVPLAIDATGVGRPVVDLFSREKLKARLRPIMITGGDSVTRDGIFTRVPKRELVSTVQVGLQTSRLKIATALPEAATLTRELQNFQCKITDAANDTYGAWREGTHDDLVLAVALALWFAVADKPQVPFGVGAPRNSAFQDVYNKMRRDVADEPPIEEIMRRRGGS